MTLVPTVGEYGSSTKRFCWMGASHTETSLENRAMLRGDETTTRRFSSREERSRVVREARCYLECIKRELHVNDEDCELTGNPHSGLVRDRTFEEEEADAAVNLACLVRGSRFRAGLYLTSGYDGTAHDTVDALGQYNAFVHDELSKIVAGLRAATGAVTSGAEADLIAEAKEFAVPDPSAVTPLADEAGLLRDQVPDARAAFNERMSQHAKQLLSHRLVRTHDFLSAFREKVAQEIVAHKADGENGNGVH